MSNQKSKWRLSLMTGFIYEGEGFETVIATCDSGPGCHKFTDKQLANARLIAAAPELLEALRELLEDTQHANHDCGDLSYCPVSKARAAIAKATGG